MNATPRPIFSDLRVSSYQTDLIHISYLDLTSIGGMKNEEQINKLSASTYNMVSQAIDETEDHYVLPVAIYEYSDHTKEIEEPHIVPKNSIIETIYLEEYSGFT